MADLRRLDSGEIKTEKRKDGYRKGVRKYRSKRIDYEEKEDPDIQREIDKHGSDNVGIIQ